MSNEVRHLSNSNAYLNKYILLTTIGLIRAKIFNAATYSQLLFQIFTTYLFTMEKITSLKDQSYDTLYRAFYKAFEGYEMQVNKEEFIAMILRRGFNAGLSFGAFVNDELVSFTLNGVGYFNGKKTAYDTGTGTVKDFRGQGLASRIFEYSIPFLKQAGIRQYLLEVLQHNHAAVSVYSKQGFTVTREFNYYTIPIKNLKLKQKPKADGLEINPIDLSFISKMKSCFDFEPSWQNSFESVHRRLEDFRMFGAFVNGDLTGHCILDPSTGDITQIAVHHDFRRKGIGTALLEKAISQINFSSIKIINTEDTAGSIHRFLHAHGIERSGKQFEMVKAL
jgi:ribosomal protein S18 acetylase RimI-like enzyme